MIDTDTLRLSAALLNTRDDLRRALGDEYDHVVERWRQLITDLSERLGKTPLAVATEILVVDRLLGSSAQWGVLAAAVDVSERRARELAS